ncbi:MAG: hypothetical protein ACRDQG_00005, partial [Pseudonocardiaceae bacterium]
RATDDCRSSGDYSRGTRGHSRSTRGFCSSGGASCGTGPCGDRAEPAISAIGGWRQPGATGCRGARTSQPRPFRG